MVYVTNFLSPIKTGVEDLAWSRGLQPFFAVCGRAIAQNIRLRVIHRSGGKYPPLSPKPRWTIVSAIPSQCTSRSETSEDSFRTPVVQRQSFHARATKNKETEKDKKIGDGQVISLIRLTNGFYLSMSNFLLIAFVNRPCLRWFAETTCC